MVISCTIMYLIGRSRVGLKFKAVRDDIIIAETTGINSTHYKFLAFIIGSFSLVCLDHSLHCILLMSITTFSRSILRSK